MKEKALVKLLIEKDLKISSAESCTGGWFIGKLISVPSASKIIDSSVVVYSNSAKVKYCEVKESSIKSCGVVSEKVAGEMAKGIMQNSSANIGVGISGIAGPSGGTKDKPVGTVCFGFCINKNIKTYTCHFSGKRDTVRKKSVSFAIKKLIELLK